MKDFFLYFFQKLNSNWEYIKSKKKEILRVKKKQCKTASENQSALWNGGTIHTTNQSSILNQKAFEIQI